MSAAGLSSMGPWPSCHGAGRCRRPALRGDRPLGQRHRLEARQRDVGEPLPAGDHGTGRGLLRLRQRRLDGHLPGQQRQLGLLHSCRTAEERALQEQPQRHLHRRHGGGGRGGRQGVRDGVRHRRLRQRRLPGHPGDGVRPVHALPQQRQRHVHRRHRQGRARRAGMDDERRVVRLRQRRQARSLPLQLRAVLGEERRLLRRQQAGQALLLHPARVQADAEPALPQQRRRHVQGSERRNRHPARDGQGARRGGHRHQRRPA